MGRNTWSKPSERAEAVRRYSEGTMIKQLAYELGRPEYTISKWIRKAGAKRGHKFRNYDVRRKAAP